MLRAGVIWTLLENRTEVNRCSGWIPPVLYDYRMKRFLLGLTVAFATFPLSAQQPAAPPPAGDPIRTLVGRLDLEKYKATVKGLTAFGDRRQGTTRNAKAASMTNSRAC